MISTLYLIWRPTSLADQQNRSLTAGSIIREETLSDSFTLVVRRFDSDRTVSVEILFGEKKTIVKSYTVGNAQVGDDCVTNLKLDRSTSERQYLITIPDRSSTFGATAGIIVFRLQSWEFLIVPDDRFTVESPDQEGYSLLKCERIQKQSFSLLRGVLTSNPPKPQLTHAKAPADPVFKQKPLSVWLANYDVGSKSWPHDEADAALRAIGKPALPLLLLMLRPIESTEYEQHTPHRRAIEACTALGPAAKQALPLIERIASEDQTCRGFARFAIEKLARDKGQPE